jgi:hypothetical protein
MLFRNVGTYIHIYIASYARKLGSKIYFYLGVGKLYVAGTATARDLGENS